MNKALTPMEKGKVTRKLKGHYTGYTCYYCHKKIYKNMGLFLYRNVIYCGSCYYIVKGSVKYEMWRLYQRVYKDCKREGVPHYRGSHGTFETLQGDHL
jgi:NAD-dependent SIR2 family protein deacetylase